MRILELSSAERWRRFRHGLSWRVGPFAVCVETPVRFVAQHLSQLYAAFPLSNGEDIVDAHVSIRRRGLLRKHVDIFVDGQVIYGDVPLQQAVPAVEWTLNLCVFHRPSPFLVIHAAAVERNGLAAILPGEAGCGKSTLCAALVNRGWRLLSDEVALVRPQDGCLAPAPRPVSLKEESIAMIAELAPEVKFGPVWPDTAKGRLAHMLPSSDSVIRMDEVARPRWIVVPEFEPGAAAQMIPLPKARVFMECARNAFNYDILGPSGFSILAELIDACECFGFTYSDLGQATDYFQALADSGSLPTPA